jgi:hypothetical protein
LIPVTRTSPPPVLTKNAARWLSELNGRDKRGEIIEDIFDFNGRKELINHRSKYVKRLLALLRLAQDGDSEAISLLEEACQPSAEYSAFALIYIRPHLH